MGGALAGLRVDEFWRNTARTLNSLGDGATKEAQAWKTYWHELKYRARKRDTEIRQHAQGTGGGPAKKPLTVTESRILQLLGTVSYAGNPEVQIPLNLPNSEPAPAALPIDPLPSTSCGISQNLLNSEPAPAALPIDPLPSTSCGISQNLLNSEPAPAALPIDPLPSTSCGISQNLQNAGPSTPLSQSAPSEDSVPVGPRRGRTAAQGRNTRPYRRLRYDDPPEWARRYEEQRLRIDRQRARLLERLVEIAEQALGLYRRSVEQ